MREVMEETAHDFIPTALVGMYMSRYTSKRRGTDVTYLRFTFCGDGRQGIRPAARPWHPAHHVDDARRDRGLPGAPPQPDRAAAASTITWPASAPPLDLLHTHPSVFEGGLTLKTDVT